MADYYKRCEKAEKRHSDPGVYPINIWWECDCHGVDDHTWLPMPSSVLVIEDGLEAAVERVMPLMPEIANIKNGAWMLPDGDTARAWAVTALRAAVGEEKT